MDIKYIKKIDFFRALAILLVVLFHLDIPLFQGGFIGVDIFFVISGFLITRIITQEYSEHQNFNFGRFYLKRARRLLPSLFLMLTLVFIATYFMFSPSDFMKSTKSLFMATVIISNIFFFRQSGYFDKSSDLEPLLHTWSLGIEEQFYLLWPIALIGILSFFPKKKVMVVFLLFLLALILPYSMVQLGNIKETLGLSQLVNAKLSSAIFYLIPFRIFEFMLGGLSAFLYKKIKVFDNQKIAFNLLGLSLIIGAGLFFNKQLSQLGLLNLIPCLGISFLLLAEAPKFLEKIYHNKILGTIGKASYTWYLFHWPMIALYKYHVERALTVSETIATFALSLLISVLIYYLYENPIRKGNGVFKLGTNKLFVFGILSFIGGAGFLNQHVSANDGWLFRLEEEQVEILKEYDNVESFHLSNWGGADFKPGFISKKEDENPKVDLVMLGESHCGHLLYGINKTLIQKHNKTVFIANLMNPSAIYLPDIIPGKVSLASVVKRIDQTIEVLKQNPKATLLVSHYWAVQLKKSKAKLFDGRTVPLQNNTIGFRILMDKLDKLLELSGGDRKVILFGTGPILPYSNKLNHIERRLKPNRGGDQNFQELKFVPNQYYYAINDYLANYVSDKPNMYYFDPRVPFCDDGFCYAQKDNKFFLSDWDHISKQGSLRLIKHYEKQLLNIINGKMR